MESHPQNNVVLKLIVRNGTVWIEQENYEWPIISILEYLKSCYSNNIYPLSTLLGIRHIACISCNSHTTSSFIYYYHSHFTNK